MLYRYLIAGGIFGGTGIKQLDQEIGNLLGFLGLHPGLVSLLRDVMGVENRETEQ